VWISFAFARHDGGLDRQQLAADLGPREPRDLADLIVLLGAAIAEAPHADQLRQIVLADVHGALARLQKQLLDHLAAYIRELALEIANAPLHAC